MGLKREFFLGAVIGIIGGMIVSPILGNIFKSPEQKQLETYVKQMMIEEAEMKKRNEETRKSIQESIKYHEEQAKKYKNNK